jgi:hypothetical protein
MMDNVASQLDYARVPPSREEKDLAKAKSEPWKFLYFVQDQKPVLEQILESPASEAQRCRLINVVGFLTCGQGSQCVSFRRSVYHILAVKKLWDSSLWNFSRWDKEVHAFHSQSPCILAVKRHFP